MKSIASRWASTAKAKLNPEEEKPKAETKVESTAKAKSNPVRHQYRQTILNGLKGESYV